MFTLTSSLRFSLRFRRRRAISARRMDSSSAVKCFFTWTSIRGGLAILVVYGRERGERGDECEKIVELTI